MIKEFLLQIVSFTKMRKKSFENSLLYGLFQNVYYIALMIPVLLVMYYFVNDKVLIYLQNMQLASGLELINGFSTLFLIVLYKPFIVISIGSYLLTSYFQYNTKYAFRMNPLSSHEVFFSNFLITHLIIILITFPLCLYVTSTLTSDILTLMLTLILLLLSYAMTALFIGLLLRLVESAFVTILLKLLGENQVTSLFNKNLFLPVAILAFFVSYRHTTNIINFILENQLNQFIFGVILIVNILLTGLLSISKDTFSICTFDTQYIMGKRISKHKNSTIINSLLLFFRNIQEYRIFILCFVLVLLLKGYWNEKLTQSIVLEMLVLMPVMMLGILTNYINWYKLTNVSLFKKSYKILVIIGVSFVSVIFCLLSFLGIPIVVSDYLRMVALIIIISYCQYFWKLSFRNSDNSASLFIIVYGLLISGLLFLSLFIPKIYL